MDHVAIMKKEWGLISKILDGSKTIESRWYKSKIAPWNRISIGDTIYFKDSGSPVVAKAIISDFEQYEIYDNTQAAELMNKFALRDLGTTEVPKPIQNYIKGKKYAVFVHLLGAIKINHFNINKTGFGMQCAWLCLGDINQIKKSLDY